MTAKSAPRNALTFSLQTPADLYRKLNFEGLALHNSPPGDLTQRAYAVMNAVTTAWQLKDWVFHALEETGKLDLLDAMAARKIKGRKDFGDFLAKNSPWLNICFQLATAAKHFGVGNTYDLPQVVTSIELDAHPGQQLVDMTGTHEIIVRTRNNSISGPDLVLLLDYIWADVLVRLGLLDKDDAQ
jgi:hypothetical protein